MAKQIRAYNTRTGKYQAIHPAFKDDKAWLSARGLVIQTEPDLSQVTNQGAKQSINEQKDTPKQHEQVKREVSAAPKASNTKEKTSTK